MKIFGCRPGLSFVFYTGLGYVIVALSVMKQYASLKFSFCAYCGFPYKESFDSVVI